MKRVEVNSRTARANILLTYPTTDANKTYQLTVEKLDVPALDSLILNKTLFSVERRLALGVLTQGGLQALPQPQAGEDMATFTPQNVRNVSQLIFQTNLFFRELCQRLATIAIPHGLPYQYDVRGVGGTFEIQNVDWYSGLANRVPIVESLQAVFRPDGKIGFKFSTDGLSLFVLRLTDEGMRIFNHPLRYIALDAQGTFTSPYSGIVAPGVAEEALIALPAALVPYVKYFDNSLFSHVNYRRELVIQTSLPLQANVECDTDRSFYRRQLAAYQFPGPNTSMKYTSVVHRTLLEESQTMYSFETSLKTHNTFRLHGTELQNFHLYLVNRSYVLENGKYKQVDTPYELHNDTFWTIQFAIRPVK
jgi:hypothetical protein